VLITARHTVQRLKGAMQSYINDENVRRYHKLIAISEGNPCRNEARHQTLLRLLTEEKGQGGHPRPRERGAHDLALCSPRQGR
jgi:hypothetical protein